jgi:hypothetical protein
MVGLFKIQSMFSLLKELYREVQVPIHDCEPKYDRHPRVKAPTALDILKQDAINEALTIKAKSRPLNEIYVGVRAVFAKNEKGGEGEEIIGYKVIRRELVYEPQILKITCKQYVLPKAV